jgi:hypothetical protein
VAGDEVERAAVRARRPDVRVVQIDRDGACRNRKRGKQTKKYELPTHLTLPL